jgi:phosphoribosyl-ATP pyrophosphohydrolase
VFHLLVLLAEAGQRFDDVLDKLAQREGMSGLDEKASRREP